MPTTCQSLAALTGAASNRDAERAATAARLTGLPDDEIAAAIAERTGWSAGKIARILRLATPAEDEERRLLDLSRGEIERQHRRVRDDLIAIREDERQRRSEAAADRASVRRGGALWGPAALVAEQLDAMGCRRVVHGGCLYWLPPSDEIRGQAQSLIIAAQRDRLEALLQEKGVILQDHDHRQRLSALVERLGGIAAATRALGWSDTRRLRRCLRGDAIEPAVLARLEELDHARVRTP